MTHTLFAASDNARRALEHPMRHRIWAALETPHTISQLARLLATHKGNVAHHLRVLQKGGLVRVERTATVRGGTERYFARTSDRLRFDGREGGTRALMTGVADQIERSDGSLLHVRTVRLTENQAMRVATALDEFVESLEPAGADQPAFGVMVSVFPAPGRAVRDQG